jgi:putative ABC transport system substrate-binding protein
VDLVPLGALGALGPNQWVLGLQTGHMIADILEGKEVPPLIFPEQIEKVVNPKIAERLGVKLVKNDT